MVMGWDRRSLPPQLRRVTDHAQNFPESIHGAFILYNLLLARLSQRDELIYKYQKYLDEWQVKILSRLDIFWHHGLKRREDLELGCSNTTRSANTLPGTNLH